MGSPLGGSWGRKSSPWWFLDWLAYSYNIKTEIVIIMNYLNKCTRPLTGTEMDAIKFVSGPDQKIIFKNGNKVTAVFRGGKAFVHPKAITI